MKLTRWIAAVGIAAGTACLTPLSASADISEPDEEICTNDYQPAECGPGAGDFEYSPPQYDAIGFDRDLDDAQEEAEDLAASHCSGYDVVRIRPRLQNNGVWKYTLTYTC
jgi:hypothetical protein